MKRFVAIFAGMLMALGLGFAAPASASTSDDVGILAVVGTFSNPTVTTGDIINNQVCTAIPPTSTTVTFNQVGVDMNEVLAFYPATDPACTDPTAPTIKATGTGGVGQNPTGIPAGAAFYSST